jgi:hypothetical protein
MAKGTARSRVALGFAHDGSQALLGARLHSGVEDETHAAARHSAEHPEAPETGAHLLARAADQRLGVEVGGPRNDGLNRAFEIALGSRADGRHVARAQEAQDFVERADSLLAALPLGLRAQQVLFGDHFENGSYVLRHAPMHQHQARLQIMVRFGGDFVQAEDAMAGQQAAAADAVFRIAGCGRDALDQLDGRPQSAGILPAAAGTSQPFAENGARGHQAAIRLGQLAGERLGLSGGAHAYGNQRREQVGGNSQARAFGDIVHSADDLDTVAGPAREHR